MAASQRSLIPRCTLSLLRALFCLLLLAAAWWLGAHFLGRFNAPYYTQIIQREEISTQALKLGAAGQELNRTQKESRQNITRYPRVAALHLNSKALERSVLSSEGYYSPQMLAVFINTLSKQGVEQLGLSSPLNWDLKRENMGVESLARSLQSMKGLVIGLRGHISTRPDFTPDSLRSVCIPLEQVHGLTEGLPSANKPLPNILLKDEKLAWAPDSILDEHMLSTPDDSRKLSFPLLVRWNGEIYPTLPLRLAMQHKQIAPKDIHVHIGSHIQLGSVRYPLDDAGRSQLGNARITPLSLEQILTPHKKLPAFDGVALIEHDEQSPSAGAARLHSMAASLSLLLSEEHEQSFILTQIEPLHLLQNALQYPPTHTEIYLLAALLLWLLLMPHLPRALIHFAHLLTPLGILALSWHLANHGQWVDVFAALCAWFMLLCMGFVRTHKKRSILAGKTEIFSTKR